MPRGRGIYRDEPRDKLAQNLDTADDEEQSEHDDTTAPDPPEPPD